MNNFNLCQDCNKCCNSDLHLKLTPRDIFAISHEKKIPTLQFISEYCSLEYEDDFPIFLINQDDCDCSFLNRDCCALARKPDVCAAFPFGNTIWFQEPLELIKIECSLHHDFNDSVKERSQIFLDNQKFKEYSEFYLKDPFLQKWTQIRIICKKIISSFDRESKRLEALEKVIFYLYQNYDPTINFFTQFDNNTLKLISLLK